MKFHKSRLLLLISSLLISHTLSSTVSKGVDPDAKLPYWELKRKGMTLRLVQRLPDQTRAFFLKRGFDIKQAEIIAQSCVFQTIFKNTSSIKSGNNLYYNLNDWRVVAPNIKNVKKFSKLKTREDWSRVWDSMSVKTAAKIAFKWSLLPTRQVYQAGDYNWGMSIFNLSPGEKFSLSVQWKSGAVLRVDSIDDMQCAADIHPQSGK